MPEPARPHDKFVTQFFLFCILLGTPFVFSYLVLRNSYEVAPYKEIVMQQLQQNTIYGSAVNFNDLNYKAELAKQQKPEIVALGSSRTMQFRGPSFKKSFSNCGGVFKNLKEGEIFFDKLLSEHKPKVIILGIDYWWLNSAHANEPDRFNLDESAVTAQKLFAPFNWLFERKFNFFDYVTIIFKGPQLNRYTSFKNLGMHAIHNSSGFRSDGSYLHMETNFGLQGKDRIKNMMDELATIKAGTNERANLGYGKFVDETRFIRLKKLIEHIRESGIELIVILPPIAPAFLNELHKRKDQGEFLTDLKVRMSELRLPEFYDFTNTKDLAPSAIADLEFLDGWHGGDIVYLRMLREILKRNPSSILSQYADSKQIGSTIARFEGKVLALFTEEERSQFMQNEN